MRFTLPLLSLVLLAGCQTQRAIDAAANVAAQQGTPPIVRTTNSGTASLTIVACPMTPTGSTVLSEYLQTLSAQSPIVTATTGGTSRLVINMCPNAITADTLRAAAQAAAARR